MPALPSVPPALRWAAAALLIALLGAVAVRRTFSDNTDFDGFHQAGEVALSGEDLHAVRRYLPCFPLFFAPLAVLPLPWAAGVWYALSMAASAATLGELARLIGAGPTTRRVLWGTALLTAPFWIDGLVMGQVNPILVYFMCLGARWGAEGRCVSAGAILGTAVALKLTPALLVFLALWRGKLRLVAAAVIAFLVLAVALPVAAWGPQRTIEKYRTWSTEALVGGVGGADAGEGRSMRFNNQSVNAWTARLLTDVGAGTRKQRFTVNVAALSPETAAWVARAVLAVLAGGMLWAWGRPGRRGPGGAGARAAGLPPLGAAPEAIAADPRWAFEAALAMGGTVLFSPVAWTSHFQAMVLPVALLFREALDPAAPGRRAAIAGLAALALSLVGLASPYTRALGCPLLGCLAAWAVAAHLLRRDASPATFPA